MGQSFKEVAHLRGNKKDFDEGWERVFGKKSQVVFENQKPSMPCPSSREPGQEPGQEQSSVSEQPSVSPLNRSIVLGKLANEFYHCNMESKQAHATARKLVEEFEALGVSWN